MKKEIKKEVNIFSEFTDSLKNIFSLVLSLIIGLYFSIYLLSKINFDLLIILSSFALFITAIVIIRSKLLNKELGQDLSFVQLISLGISGGFIMAIAWQIVILKPYN